MNQPSPADITAGLRSGNPQIVSWLYETYGPRLLRYLCRRVGDVELARDLHNEVFVRVLECAERYEDRGVPVSAWLYRIARDRATDTIRRAQRQRLPELDVDEVACAGPETTLEPAWERDSVQQALAQLPALYRQVLHLRFVYELSIEEAARQLGRTAAATKALQHRALVALRRQLVGAEQSSAEASQPPELTPDRQRTYSPPMA